MIEHSGFVVWLTGLSGAGKTTISTALEALLRERQIRLERLDNDTIRQTLSRDLGFSKEDRDKNIERVTFVAQLLSRNHVGVVASFISPYAVMRAFARQQTTNFIEVFVDAPLEVCISRDVKGLYAKALRGEIPNFTGISDPYEAPQQPDVHLRTDLETVEGCVLRIVGCLEERGLIPTLVVEA